MAGQRVIISTEWPNVTLEQYTLADAPTIFDLIDASRPHLSQFGDETAAKYPTLDSVAESIRINDPSVRLRLGIWDRQRLVGGINLTKFETGLMAELGYWLGAAQTGKGYATVAARSLVAHGLHTIGYRLIIAKVTIGNEASVDVLTRVGFCEMRPTPNGGQRWFCID